MKIKSITICSSASAYKQAWVVKTELEKLGYKVWIPLTAKKMNQTKNYKVSHYKAWYKDPKKFITKAWLMRKHFSEIEKADAILVTNFTKNKQTGYIGGNVLMEMALAFYLKKPVFLLNKPSRKSVLYEEIMGVRPVILNGDLELIK
ncbi:MAG: hypothetical protein Q8R08_04930 [bacterium]|nr:hypothetical protein [bacterium]